MSKLLTVLALVTVVVGVSFAQFGGFGSGGSNPYNNGGSSGNSGSDSDPYNDGGEAGSSFGQFSLSRYSAILTAHAVLATLAFAFFLPVGGILIRLASFPGLWWAHALIQAFGYALYTAAFAMGVWLVTQTPSQYHLLKNAHPIIGIVLFVVVFFQVVLGFLHHFLFKRYARRVVWSYGHIWLGRIIITLGIINGGLGLRLAKRMPLLPPSTGAIIGYGVAAGIMWAIYMISTVIGERRRARRNQATKERAGRI